MVQRARRNESEGKKYVNIKKHITIYDCKNQTHRISYFLSIIAVFSFFSYISLLAVTIFLCSESFPTARKRENKKLFIFIFQYSQYTTIFVRNNFDIWVFLSLLWWDEIWELGAQTCSKFVLKLQIAEKKFQTNKTFSAEAWKKKLELSIYQFCFDISNQREEKWSHTECRVVPLVAHRKSSVDSSFSRYSKYRSISSLLKRSRLEKSTKFPLTRKFEESSKFNRICDEHLTSEKLRKASAEGIFVFRKLPRPSPAI